MQEQIGRKSEVQIWELMIVLTVFQKYLFIFKLKTTALGLERWFSD